MLSVLNSNFQFVKLRDKLETGNIGNWQHYHIGNIYHNRFLILDGKELYLIGASLKDFGRKCFGFTSLDKSNIPDILAKI